MKAYPLLFNRGDVVVGNGFFAAVQVRGRVLLTEEDETFAVYGVNPGGVASEADDRSSALAGFSRAYLEVIRDIAFDADSFEQFHDEVKAFFDESCNVEDWDRAVEDVRCKGVSIDWARRDSADSPRSMQITLIPTEGVAASFNPEIHDEYQEAA